MRRVRSWMTPAVVSMVGMILLGAVSPRVADALPKHVPGELLIKFRPAARAAERASIRQQLRAHKLRDLPLIRAEHLRIEGIGVEQAIERFRRHPLVEYVEPNFEVQALVVPNDPMFPQLYGLQNTGQTGGTPGADIRATLAWDLFTGDPDLRVGVVDTGVDFTHPDLAANVWTNPGEIPGNGIDDEGNGYVDDVHGYDFVNDDGNPMDDHSHGTHVSGTIAGVGDNGIGVVGVAWQAKIVAVKFLGAGGSGSIAGAVQAMQYLDANGIKLSNHSWGGPFSQAFLDALNAAGVAGHLIVAAAGNASSDIDVSPTYPAAYDTPYQLTVAASDDHDALAGFSNYGLTRVDLAAPGVDIWSSLPGGGYGYFSGTSMAAPHVTGAMALVMGRFPSMSALQARDHLLLAVDPVAAFQGITVTGGRLNAYTAVFEPDAIPPGVIGDLAAGELGSNTVRLSWTATGDDGAVGRARRYELRYSLSPISEATFAGATPAPAPAPRTSGSAESAEVGGLAFNTTYYFAVRAVDETQNPGPISNLVVATTLGIPDIAASPLSFSHQLFTGATATQILTLRNDAAGTLDFTIPVPGIAQATSFPSLDLAKGEADPRVGDPVILGAGGPDGFGYRWIDSDQPGGPVFDWVDISGDGQPVPIGGDDQTSLPIPMGMSFPFYGTAYTSVRVCTNGFISFTDGSAAYSNQPLPSIVAPATMIAPFWDDLYVGPSQIRVRSDGTRFIIAWLGVYHLGGYGPYTFQIILEADGGIRYQYLSMASVSGSTTGIQDGTRTIGLTAAFNTNYLHDGLAMRFTRVPQWLQVSPQSGRIGAGQSAEVQLNYDTYQVMGGTYQSNLQILSNDPDESPLTLPVNLTVIGAPDIRATPLALDYGQLFVGYPRTRSFRVNNAGTDVLHVTGVTTPDPTVTLVPASFTLSPGDSQWVAVTWSPVTPGSLSAPLTIASDDPDTPSLAIATLGSAVLPPQIEVTPSSLAATLAIPESATQVLHLSNTGNSPLIWSAVVAGPPAAGPSGSLPPFDPPAAWSPDPRRHDHPVIALPVPPADALALPVVVTDPAGDGGPVDLRYLRGDGGGQLRVEMEMTAPINASNFGGYLSFDTDRNRDTGVPPSAGAPGQDIGAEYEALLFYLSSGVVPVYRVDGHFMGEFPAQVSGNLVRITIPLSALGDDDGTLDLTGVVGNQFEPTDWFPDAGHGTIHSAGWLTAAPASGVLAPGEATDIQVSLATADLIGGTYQASLEFQSNDPADSVVTIPVTLVAIGVTDIAFEPPGLNFSTLLVGNTREINVHFKNVGTDSLRIFSAAFDHPSFSLVNAGLPVVIVPGDSVTRVVRFAPGEVCQPCNGTLSLVTNDPDENPAILPLTGVANPPPDVALDPSSLSITLPIPGTGTRPLTIANLGTGPLTFSFPILAPAGTQQVHPGIELDKGAVDPRPGTLGQGGPDGFGYRWRDSDEPGGPAFQWIDIVGSGQAVPIQGDDLTSNPIPMGMNFPYYGNTFSSLRVSTNGFVSFTSPSAAYTNQPLPSPFAPENMIAPYWDDLWVENTTSVWVRGDGSRFIISWVGVRHLGGDGPYTFQIILESNGRITYQYLDMTPNAVTATTGMQDGTASNGLTMAFNTPYVHDGLAAQISRFPSWLSVSPGSGSVAPGGSVEVQVSFDTQGMVGGVYSDVLGLETNDPDEPSPQIPVTLTAIGIPDLDAQPAALDFGPLFVGLTRDLAVRLANAGSEVLQLGSLSVSGSSFSMFPDSLPPGYAIAPGETLEVVVRFAPSAPCSPCPGALHVPSNDPDESPFQIALTGVGLPPPAITLTPAILVATQPISTVQDWGFTIANPGQSPLSFSFPDFAGGAPAQVDPGLELERGQPDPRPGVLNRGGPDGFGYRWRDSDEPGGPAFQWIDIVGTGTQLPFQYLDQNIPGVPIGFSFPFYGGTFNTLNVCTHGWFSFTNYGIQWTNQPLPSQGAPENLVAPFWDDLNIPGGGQVWYQATPTRFVITWYNVPRTGGGGRVTFQAILHPNGRIIYQYLDLLPPQGVETVGVQNGSRNTGLLVVFNAPYLHNGLAIEITKVPQWLEVTPVSGVVAPGGSLALQARITTNDLTPDLYQESLRLATNVPGAEEVPFPVYVNAGVFPSLGHPPLADFGTVYVGYPEDLGVPLFNSGAGVLRLDSAQATGAGFSRIGDLPEVLFSGQTATVSLRYAPQAPCAPCTGALAITSNDPARPVSTMALNAVGLLAPVIGASPDSLRAAAATTLGPEARQRLRSLLVSNTGGSDLVFSAQAQLNPPVDSIPYQPTIMSKGGADPNPGLLGTGGPDQFGYRWRDSDEPAGPTLEWVDITGVGTLLPIAGDDATLPGVPIGFAFPFYGGNFSSVNVCTNGFVSFSSTSSQYWNVPLPFDQAPENLLAAWWSDLYLTSPRIWVHNDGSRFIVSWVGVRHLSGVGDYSFQIILYPNGRFRFQYLSMAPPIQNATIGIQNASRDDGLGVTFNAPYVHGGLAIEFTSPPRWLSVNPSSGVIPAGGSATIELGFDAEDIDDGDHRGWLEIGSNDPATPTLELPCRLHVGVVGASLSIDPNAINRDSQGNWVTTGIDLAPDLEVHQIVQNTVRVQRALPIAPGAPVSFPDVDLDGTPEMEIKFERAPLVGLLPDGDTVPVEVIGEVDGITWFQAFDAVRFFSPGVEDPGALYQAGSSVALQWNPPSGATVQSYDLWFSFDAGETWTLAEGGITGTSCVWSVPTQTTETGLLELVASDDQGHMGSWLSQQFRIVAGSVAVEESGPVPGRFALEFAGPSPARGAVDLRVAVPAASAVTVGVFDLRGARVRELAGGAFAPGWHRLRWDGADARGHLAAPGVYFVRLKAGATEVRRRVTLLR